MEMDSGSHFSGTAREGFSINPPSLRVHLAGPPTNEVLAENSHIREVFKPGYISSPPPPPPFENHRTLSKRRVDLACGFVVVRGWPF